MRVLRGASFRGFRYFLCLRAGGKLGRQTKSIARAIAYIDENLSDPNLSMEAAADYVGLSVSYFSRTFKAVGGKGYTDYVADKRIEMADRLSQTTRLKIYEIAERVGYTSPKYFSKVYKEHTGKKHTEKQENEV